MPKIVEEAVIKVRRSFGNLRKSSKDATTGAATTEPVPHIDRSMVAESSISAAQLKRVQESNEAAAKAFGEGKPHIVDPAELLKNLDLSDSRKALSSSRQLAASSSSASNQNVPQGVSVS